MIRSPADYPFPGSFALLIDTNLPAEQRRCELVRIMRYDPDHGQAAVAFPLRVGASGNRVIASAELIDATPLTTAEAAELETLRDHLGMQARPNRKKIERAEALRRRQIYGDAMRFELKRLDLLERKAQPSIGSRIPREHDGAGPRARVA
jgi:hypothetical protein